MASVHERYHSGFLRPSHILLRSRVLLGVAAAGAVALTLLSAFAHGALLAVDAPVSEALRDESYVPALRAVTRLGSPTPAAAVSFAVAALLWRRCRAFALALPVTVLGGVVADVALKTLVDRPRPELADIGTALASYPSGHTIQATIVFGLLVPALYLLTGRRWVAGGAVALFVVVTGAVAVSRIGLGAHWPTDVLGSFLIGSALLLAAEYFTSSRRVEQLCGECHLHVPRSGHDVPLSALDDGERTGRG